MMLQEVATKKYGGNVTKEMITNGKVVYIIEQDLEEIALFAVIKKLSTLIV